jgi:hypothetical protein
MFACSVGYSKKIGTDGQLCAECIGLAQMEQLSTMKVLASLMDWPTLRVSSLLVSPSIFMFNSASPFNS